MKADWSWKPDGKFVQPEQKQTPPKKKPLWLKKIIRARKNRQKHQ